MKSMLRLLVAIGLAVQVVGTVRASVPYMMAYQGRLTDSGGKAVQGTFTITIRLYDALTSGTKLWEESQTVSLAEADNGVFNLTLGSSSVLTSVDFNSPIWLSAQIEGDTEMTPRQRITAVGYAMNADKLDGLDSTSFLRSDTNTSTSGKLTITRSGTALVITPSSDPDASTKLVDVQNAAGTTKFSVDLEGDTVVAGDLTVSGTISGTTSASGTTSTTFIVDNDNTSGTEPASGAGLVIEGGSGDASILWDATNDELDVNQSINVASAATVGTDLTVTSGMRVGTGSTPDNFTALADDSLFVEGNVEVDGTLYAAAATIGGTAVGDISAVGDITSGAAFTATSGADGTTLYFEGSTSDGYEVALTSANPSSDITVTIPATTGTLITTGDSGTVTSAMISNSTITADDLGANSVDSSELVATAVTAASYGSATQVPALTVDADGRLTSASNTTISIGASNISADSLDFTEFKDTMALDASTTIQMGGFNLILDDMTSSAVLQLQNAQSSADTATFYVANTATANAADLVISPSDGGLILDTTGSDADGSHSGVDLASSGGSPALDNVTDARDALAIAVDPTATDSDGVIKLGRNGGSWEYIWYDNDARSDAGEFVFSASTRVESSSPAYLLFSPPTASGSSPGARYGIKFDPEVTPKTISFVEITNPTTTPIENTLFEMKAGGQMGLEFANLVRNGSFEAFSALEKFKGVGYTGAFQHGTSAANSFEGGWDNFAPDEWVWVAGDVLQHSPLMLANVSASVTTDIYHGKSAVGIKDAVLGTAYTTPGDGNDGGIKQTLHDLKPSTTYAVAVKALVTNASNSTALLDVTGEDSAGQLTPVQQSAAAALSTQATTYTSLIGTFKTDSSASDVTIFLLCRQTGTPAAADMCRFDAAQMVTGKSVPEFAPNPLVDSGDQTLYGLLRVARTTDSSGGAGGGILAVDRFVRTRGVDFFTGDPGFTGTAGGIGTIGPTNPSTTNPGGTAGSLTLTTSGTYTGGLPSEYKVRISATGTPNTFKWSRRTLPAGAFGTESANVNVSTSATALEVGVNVAFNATTGGNVNDEWRFQATGMAMQDAYSSFSPTASYTPGESRIFKDEVSGKLTFQEGTKRVTLDQITADIAQPATIDAPVFSGTGGLAMTTLGTYSGTDSRTYEILIDGNSVVGCSSADSFKWRKITSASFTTGVCVPTNNSAVTLENGIQVKFFNSPSLAYNEGALNDRWTFNAYPSASASNKVSTLKASGLTALTGNLVLAAGSNVSLSQDDTTKTITITASAGGAIGDIDAVGSCGSGACFADGTNHTLVFEGSSTDTIETTFGATNPTSGDQTINLPDFAAAGTYVLAGDATAVTNLDGLGLAINSGTLDFTTTELTGNRTWDDGTTDASVVWTWGLSGATDPAITFGNNSIDVTTGALKVGGNAVLTAETDGVIGNEVTDVANSTLSRSGAGSGADPYKLALNLATANTWTGATALSKVNAAGGGADDLTLSGTLGIMDGSDTYRGLYVNLTNANHTGSSNAVTGLDIAGVTADADATEYALQVGSGWDRALSVSGTDVFTFGAGDFLQLDGATTVSTTTAGVLDLNVTTTTDGNEALNLAYQVNDDAGAGAETMKGLELAVTQLDISGVTSYGAHLYKAAASATGAAPLTAGLLLENQDTDADAGGADTAANITDAILIQATTNGTIVDALDVSDAEITNAINIGANDLIANDGSDKTISAAELIRLDGKDAALVDGNDTDVILEAHLKAVDTAADEECLTYEATVGDFEWQSCGVGAETDGTVGNEVTDAANTTLTRSGTGDANDPYKLALNLATANTWTGATTFSKVNAAGGSADNVTLSGTLGAMDATGTDIYRGVYVNLTNANHTGGSAYGLDVAGITADADATEYALQVGSGWDRALSVSGTDVFTFGAGDFLQLDGATTVSTTTAGVLDLNVTTTTDGNEALNLAYQVNDDAGAGAETMKGLELAVTQLDISGVTSYGAHLYKAAATATGAAPLTAGLLIENLDTDADAGGADTAGNLTDALKIQATTNGTIVDALDVSDAEITNAINIGANDLIANDGSDKTISAAELIRLDGKDAALVDGNDTDVILEAHLKAVDTAADEECLTYEATVGDFEWQTCGGGGAPTDAEYVVSAADGTLSAEDVFTDGLAIDSTNASGTLTVAFDPTELLGSRTWGDASTDTIVWTWDRNSGTDPTLTMGNAQITANSDLSAKKADPSLILDVTTATDTDFWLGVQDDAGSDDDDKFQIGDGSSPGSNAFVTVDTSGQVGIGTASPNAKLDVSGTTRLGDSTTNYTAISATGVMTYAGSAQPVRTIVLTAAGAIAPAGSSTRILNMGTNFVYNTINFADGSTQDAYWQFVVPDAYTGSTVTATLYYLTGAACSAGSCEVVWNVATDGKATGAAFDAALQTAAASTASANGTAGVLNATSAMTVTTGWAAGEVAIVKVSRIGGDAADDVGTVAKLVQVKIEWTASAESD